MVFFINKCISSSRFNRVGILSPWDDFFPCDCIIAGHNHCVKSVQIRSYFWSAVSCIQTEYRKIRTRNNYVFRHFSRNEWICEKCKQGKVKVRLSPSKKFVLFTSSKPFTNDEKYFLFHLKSYFRCHKYLS